MNEDEKGGRQSACLLPSFVAHPSKMEAQAMADDARLRQLLEVALDSDLTPEEVCRECPDLLPQVRRRWQHLRTVAAQFDALFPTPRPRQVAPADELPALPGYEVLAVLGRGGMGVVYKAMHLRLGRAVAIKMLLAGAAATAEERQRFLREARAAAGLRHPNVVQLHDVGEADGRPFYVMEFVERGSLARKLQGAPQPAGQAAALVATLADAVQAAHDSGVVHRDLKPANVLLTADGTPKVCDFGLARPLEGGASLTLSGVPMGTPSYVAPEQARGDRSVGPAADVYALGAILYECLTGRPPFRAETAAATLFQVVSDDPVPPARLNPQVPRDLQTICLKCLHKQPQSRYASAQALADDLRRFERGEPIAARPVGVVARKGYEVHLTDAVPLHVEQARVASARQPDCPLASAAVGDARRLDRPDGADAVLLLGPLYHLTGRADRLAAWGEARRVLRPGGVVVAAAISRFASTLDGLRLGLFGDPAFARIAEQDLLDGQHRNPTADPRYFTSAFFHHPAELKSEAEEAGLRHEATLGVEGPGWLLQDFDRWWGDSGRRARLLAVARAVESEPSLLGVSAHILAVARKAGD
jgi:SAM-dependent methyltransferase